MAAESAHALKFKSRYRRAGAFVWTIALPDDIGPEHFRRIRLCRLDGFLWIAIADIRTVLGIKECHDVVSPKLKHSAVYINDVRRPQDPSVRAINPQNRECKFHSVATLEENDDLRKSGPAKLERILQLRKLHDHCLSYPIPEEIRRCTAGQPLPPPPRFLTPEPSHSVEAAAVITLAEMKRPVTPPPRAEPVPDEFKTPPPMVHREERRMDLLRRLRGKHPLPPASPVLSSFVDDPPPLEKDGLPPPLIYCSDTACQLHFLGPHAACFVQAYAPANAGTRWPRYIQPPDKRLELLIAGYALMDALQPAVSVKRKAEAAAADPPVDKRAREAS